MDELAASLSFKEFSNQFLLELDYDQERSNLQTIYDSSINNNTLYKKRGIIIPKLYNDLCTNRIITMKYLPGPKLEEEAKKQLALLGIDISSRNLRKIVTDVTDRTTTTTTTTTTKNDTEGGQAKHNDHQNNDNDEQQQLPSERKDSITNKENTSNNQQQIIGILSDWKLAASKSIVSAVGFDNVFKITRYVFFGYPE